MASVLVTGGSGPIGRYVVDALSDRGEHVVSYGRAQHGGQDPNTDAALGELFDLPRLLHVMLERGVQQVVHAADTSDPCLSLEMPVATVVANVEGTLHLLEAARLAGLKGRIVLLSSAAVYGDNDGPIDESASLRPRTPYAVTKVTSEQLGDIYTDLYGLDVIALRLGQPYGPELALPPLLESMIFAAIKGEPFRASTGADQSFHLTHGEDVSRAVIAALGPASPNRRVFNVTGGERHSLEHIAALVRERFSASRIELGPGELPGLDRQGPLDIRAADRELGYRPRWGLARGLDDYVEWLLAQREAA